MPANELSPTERREVARIRAQVEVEQRRAAEIRNDYRSRERLAILENSRTVDKMVALAYERYGIESGGNLSKNRLREALSTPGHGAGPGQVNQRIQRHTERLHEESNFPDRMSAPEFIAHLNGLKRED